MIGKFNSYEGTVTDFCKENNINKSQFYAYRKKLGLSNITTFHAIPLKKENTVGGTDKTLNPKEIRIEIGKAAVFLPIDEASIFSEVLREIIKI
ncbi:MAG: hypothetical protein AB6733_24530 [Clostridiaceae bacterium]